MKKLLIILLLAIGTISTKAEITDSIATPKYESNWLVKAGIGPCLDWGDGSRVNYIDALVAVGYQHQISPEGLYAGATAGCKLFWIGPFVEADLGIKKQIATKKVFDGHIGLGWDPLSIYGFYNRWHASVNAGIWFNRFLLELNYRCSTQIDGAGDCYPLHYVYLNFGFKF